MANGNPPLPRILNAAPIRPPKAAEMEVRRLLTDLARRIQASTLDIVLWIQAGDTSPIQIANALQERLELWRGVDVSTMAREWVAAVDANARRLLADRVKTALRVDTAAILDNGKVREAVELAAHELEKKIVQIPEAYIEGVADAAIQAYKQIPFPEGRTLTQQLMHINDMSFDRAKFIARHQTSVINSTVNRARQTAIGIEEYFWSSSHDGRTVGNPGGKYPHGSVGHGNHWARDYRNNGNKAYRWDEPFDDGFPGEAYNCRCKSIARIDSARLDSGMVMVGEPAAVMPRFAPARFTPLAPAKWEKAA